MWFAFTIRTTEQVENMEVETPNVEIYSLDDYRAKRMKLARIVGAAVTGLAALVYLCTLSPGVFPGESATLMAVYSGLEPMVSPAHTIWGAIVRAVAALGAGGMAFRLNFLCLVFGVAGVWLIFDIMQRVIGSLVERETASPADAAAAACIGGGAAAVALAFSVPYWMCSTRLQYQGFNVLLLLLLFRVLVWYLESDGPVVLILFALLSGLFTVESLGIACFLPFFALTVVMQWVRRGSVRGSSISGACIAFAAGVASALLIANSFAHSHDISLRGYANVWSIVQSIFRDQAIFLKNAIPREGWLNLVIVVAVPWVAATAIARQGLNETREWGIMILHAAMSVAVILVLGNAPMVSPWGLFREAGEVLPVPLLAVNAMTTGYLLAYWFLIVRNSTLVNIDGERTFAQRSSVWFGYFFGTITAVMVVLATGINILESNGRSGKFVDECVREILKALEGRKWIVSDGLFDSHILVEAHRTGQNVRLLELQSNDNKVYLRHLRNVINEDPDFKSPGIDIGKLLNGADLGVIPFIQDWLENDPSAIDRMLVVSAPDIIYAAGRTVYPHYFCFKAGPKDVDKADDSFLESHRAFWTRMQKTLAKSRGVRDAAAIYKGRVRRQVGFVANNSGVLLEDMGRDEDAYQTYQFIRQLDPNNISAALNLMELLHRHGDDGFHSDARETVENDVVAMLKELNEKRLRLPIWSLSRHFGYVRNPLLFTKLGWAWAASGQPGIAMSGLQRAEEIATTKEERIKVRTAEAELLWRQNDIEGTESIYESVLKEDPSNTRAMISISRVQTRRGSIEKAREWLARARDNGADKTVLAFEGATIDLAAGHPEEARIKLSEVTDVQPNNLQAWGMLAIAALQMQDTDDVENRILPRMEAIAGTTDDYLCLVIKGQLLYQKKDLVGARDSFERASMRRPGITNLMEWILRLDFALDDKRAAEDHARQIMRSDRTNAFANYIMGSIMMFRGRMEEAEDYLRRSVGSTSTPEALNDLAELLCRTGNLNEAKKRVRDAISLAPGLYAAWDTLGGILAAEGDIPGAEEAYLKALELYQEDWRVYINYAKVLIRKNELPKAREYLTKANAHRNALAKEDQDTLADLLRQATPRGGR